MECLPIVGNTITNLIRDKSGDEYGSILHQSKHLIFSIHQKKFMWLLHLSGSERILSATCDLRRSRWNCSPMRVLLDDCENKIALRWKFEVCQNNDQNTAKNHCYTLRGSAPAFYASYSRRRCFAEVFLPLFSSCVSKSAKIWTGFICKQLKRTQIVAA